MTDEAFVEFYRREFRGAVKLAFLLCGSQAVAEDLVQDSFIAVAARFSQLTSPSAYLRTTVVHTVAGFHRRELRRAARLPWLYPGAEHEGDQIDPKAFEVAEVLATLPYNQRAALVLRYWGGLSNAEISEVLGCRIGTTKSWISRGLTRLRTALEANS